MSRRQFPVRRLLIFFAAVIFPKWTNSLPLVLAAVAALAGVGVAAGVTIYLTPKYTRAGYQPGPRFKEMLALAEDAQLEGRIGSREEGMRLIREAFPGE